MLLVQGNLEETEEMPEVPNLWLTLSHSMQKEAQKITMSIMKLMSHPKLLIVDLLVKVVRMLLLTLEL